MQVLLLSRYWTTQAELAQSDNTKVLFYEQGDGAGVRRGAA